MAAMTFSPPFHAQSRDAGARADRLSRGWKERPSSSDHRVPLLSRLGRWSFRHRRAVVGSWLLGLVAVVAISSAWGAKFNSSLDLPGTDSQAALTLLQKNFPAASGERDQVVIQAMHGVSVRSPQVRTAVSNALADVARVPGVASVSSPYSSLGAAQVGGAGTVAFATVTWSQQPSAVTTAEAKQLIQAAKSADGPFVHIALGGPAISSSERPGPGPSVVVGLVGALVILLIVFGGAVASSLMPLAGAVLALGIATSLVGILSNAMAVPSFATDLAILLGLGVGVDYGLFIVSRHRSAVKAGLSYEDAAAQAVNTSGRTVLFAGMTVCIALLGQFALGVTFLYGLSIAAAVTVLLTMLTALTFLPAMFGFLGPKVLARRERAARDRNIVISSEVSPFWLRWAKAIEAHKLLVAVSSSAVVIVVALPILGLRLGASAADTDPVSSTTYQAYQALARGFGQGFNGPLELVGQVRSKDDVLSFDRFLTAAAHIPDVTSVTPSTSSPDGRVMLATLYPASNPEAQQTVSLVNHLRNVVIPLAERDISLKIHVGGFTATNIDFAHVLSIKLPLFIAVVVILAFLLLMMLFRSLAIPLVASLMNLLSIGAALGALNAVFNWGYAHSVLGQSGTGPVDAFIPVLMFSVLFGLSMDYEVYLVSRIQEDWLFGRAGSAGAKSIKEWSVRDNHRAVTTGQAKSGRIVVAAAAIMILVFGSFLLGGQRGIAEFGFGLAFAVMVDALVIRSLLVPAIMHVIGPTNWTMPGWLDRILPRASIETEGETPIDSNAGGDWADDISLAGIS